MKRTHDDSERKSNEVIPDAPKPWFDVFAIVEFMALLFAQCDIVSSVLVLQRQTFDDAYGLWVLQYIYQSSVCNTLRLVCKDFRDKIESWRRFILNVNIDWVRGRLTPIDEVRNPRNVPPAHPWKWVLERAEKPAHQITIYYSGDFKCWCDDWDGWHIERIAELYYTNQLNRTYFLKDVFYRVPANGDDEPNLLFPHEQIPLVTDYLNES